MDRLTDFLQRFDLRARVLHNGSLTRVLRVEASEGSAHLHLLRSGSLQLLGPGRRQCTLGEPALVFLARPARHELRAPDGSRADLLSAAIDFGAGDENPLLQGMALPLRLPLSDIPDMAALFSVLLDEAAGRRCGHAAVLDRLVEVLVVKLLRLAIERRLMDRGVMAGLSDPRLARALTAVHAAPQIEWTLEDMAARAGMSRSRFAEHFSAVMGVPAAEYLKRWRIGLAKRMLREGHAVKQVALEVGYGSSASFGRAFSQIEGAVPTAWLRAAQGEA
jgi:AraC-like DNA-binding protein